MRLIEWGSVVEHSLSREQVSAIASHRALAISPFGLDGWQVSATQYVGTVQLADLSIKIAPKIPVARLMELLCESSHIITWSDAQTEYDTTEDLLSVVTDSWCQFVERVLNQGLQQGYKSIDDAMYGIRGRIRLADQMSRHAGLAVPVEVTYDEYTPDILENQLMAGACRILLRLSVTKKTRMRLHRIAKALVDVTPIEAQPSPPEPSWSRLNQRYRPVGFLSRLILSASSLEQGESTKTIGASFLVDMNKVFEDVVGTGLKRIIERDYGGEVLLQHSQQLDQAGLFSIRPDLVWRYNGEYQVVVDFKYKLPESKQFSISDIYQALAYMTRYGLKKCLLVYAEPPGRNHVIVKDMTICIDWVDIGREREGRLRDIERLVSVVCENLPKQPANAHSA